jgi:hypothetical protein
LLTFVNAAGAVIISIWVIKAKFGDDGHRTVNAVVSTDRYETRRYLNRFYGYTKSHGLHRF